MEEVYYEEHEYNHEEEVQVEDVKEVAREEEVEDNVIVVANNLLTLAGIDNRDDQHYYQWVIPSWHWAWPCL